MSHFLHRNPNPDPQPIEGELIGYETIEILLVTGPARHEHKGQPIVDMRPIVPPADKRADLHLLVHCLVTDGDGKTTPAWLHWCDINTDLDNGYLNLEA